MTYSKDLKNGQWQKKRLEILQRDNFKCLCCKSQDNLVVHHLYYKYGLKPWQYKNDSLVTLCGVCHTKLHDELAEKAGKIAFDLLLGVYNTDNIQPLNFTKKGSTIEPPVKTIIVKETIYKDISLFKKNGTYTGMNISNLIGKKPIDDKH